MNIGKKYTIRDKTGYGNIIKSNATLRAIIGVGQVLSEEQVLDYYFNGDEEKMQSSRYPLEQFTKVHHTPKFVFDTCVIPMTKRYYIEEV